MDVRDRIVVITGASVGIGRATAQVFAGAGAKLILAARSAETLTQLAGEVQATGGEAVALPTDMRDGEQIRRLIAAVEERYGRLDILINNAGQSAVGAIAEVDPDHLRQILELNLIGPLVAMQTVIPIMRRQGGGLIINVSSNVTQMTIPTIGAYAATKSALNKLSDTARVELAADNIRVVTVYPRLTDTDFGKNAIGQLSSWVRRRNMPQPDSAAFVAERILAAARDEPAEQFMEDQPALSTAR